MANVALGIQTRYLFVRPVSSITVQDAPLAGEEFKQDPTRRPTGPASTPIRLPLSAIPKSRRKLKDTSASAPAKTNADRGSKRPLNTSDSRWNKAAKLTAEALESVAGSGRGRDSMASVDDTASVDTAPEDLEILFEPPEAKGKRPATPPPEKPRLRVPIDPCTAFAIQPITNLPLTPVPNYATTQASKRLQKDFRNLLATQEKHIRDGTLADLGWYIDPEHITRTSNLYQWIAELHSFPLTLPLAQDLKKSGLQSVVLEIRFHATYPMSPPFVRVVRPRFLPFASGGGGHVTAGGSICAELLTNNGWTAVSDIESVLLQIRMAIMSLEPKPARLAIVALGGGRVGRGAYDGAGSMDYSVGEAVDAFKRACMMHGWTVPEGLNDIAAQSYAMADSTMR